MRPARGSGRLVLLAYLLNGAGLAALVLVLVLYRLQQPVEAAGLASTSNPSTLNDLASTTIVAGRYGTPKRYARLPDGSSRLA